MRVHTSRSLILSLLSLAVVSSPAVAQGGLMIGGGLTMPRGDYGDAFKSGYHAMVGVQFGSAASPLGIRVDGAYHLNDFDVSGDPDAAGNLIAVSGDAVFNFPSTGVRPYILGGITWGNWKCVGDDCLSDNSESGTGFNIGGGINLGGVFAEARYISIGGDLDVKVVPITIGFAF